MLNEMRRFSDRIQPWLHYVPISIDYSDLYDTFIFFRGGLSGENNHDELAKKIGYAGSAWADTFWRDEDATAYMYRYVLSFLHESCLDHLWVSRLLLEYARIMSLDREAMSFKLHPR